MSELWVVFYWDEPFQPKPDLVETVKFPNRTTVSTVVTGHKHFQHDFLNFCCQRWQDGERPTRYSVVFHELLEELVLPHCGPIDELEYSATLGAICFDQTATASSEKPPQHQGSENRRLKRAPLLFVDNFTGTTCILEQFTHKKH